MSDKEVATPVVCVKCGHDEYSVVVNGACGVNVRTRATIPRRCGCHCVFPAAEQEDEMELKPCPFCGSESVVWSDCFQRVRCNGCFIGTPSVSPAHARTDESAAALKARSFNEWNTRCSSEVENQVEEVSDDEWVRQQVQAEVVKQEEADQDSGNGIPKDNSLTVADAVELLREEARDYTTHAARLSTDDSESAQDFARTYSAKAEVLRACVERLESYPTIEIVSSLPADRDDLLAALERAQQSRNALYTALSEAIETIFAGRLGSIGSLKNVYSAQVYVKDVVRWHDTLSLAPKSVLPAPPITQEESESSPSPPVSGAEGEASDAKLRKMYDAACRAGLNSAEGRTFEEWRDKISDYGLDDARQALQIEEETRKTALDAVCKGLAESLNHALQTKHDIRTCACLRCAYARKVAAAYEQLKGSGQG